MARSPGQFWPKGMLACRKYGVALVFAFIRRLGSYVVCARCKAPGRDTILAM